MTTFKISDVIRLTDFGFTVLEPNQYSQFSKGFLHFLAIYSQKNRKPKFVNQIGTSLLLIDIIIKVISR